MHFTAVRSDQEFFLSISYTWSQDKNSPCLTTIPHHCHLCVPARIRLEHPIRQRVRFPRSGTDRLLLQFRRSTGDEFCNSPEAQYLQSRGRCIPPDMKAPPIALHESSQCLSVRILAIFRLLCANLTQLSEECQDPFNVRVQLSRHFSGQWLDRRVTSVYERRREIDERLGVGAACCCMATRRRVREGLECFLNLAKSRSTRA